MITFEDLREASGGQLFGELAAETFGDFCTDWQAVQAGQLYVALRHKTGYDGHQYIAEAIEAGATGLMCVVPPTDVDTSNTTVLVVDDVDAALIAWAGHMLDSSGATIVAVTGSAARSSALQSLAAILRTRYEVYDTVAGSSGMGGVALGLGSLAAEHQIVLFELDDSDSVEVSNMLAIAHPHVVLVTSDSATHSDVQTDGNESVTGLQRVVDAMIDNGGVVLNYDDDNVREIDVETSKQVIHYGLDISGRGFGAELLAYNIQFFVDKVGFDLRQQEERYPGHWIPLLGRQQLYAALAALAAGQLLDVPLSDALRSLTSLHPVSGRMTRYEGVNGSVLVDDSFDADVEAVFAALEYLEASGDDKRRRVMIMGDTSGAGTNSDAAYKRIGNYAGQVCDLFITRGKQAALAGKAARDIGLSHEQVRMVYSHADAARIAAEYVEPGDVVVVEGSQSARMEHVSERLLANRQQDAMLLPRREPVDLRTVSDRSRVSSWIELDLDACAENIRHFKRFVGLDVTLMAVVKANAYGHGAVEIATTAINNGAGYLGVGDLNEALALRQAGIEASILILGYTPAWALRDAIEHNITVTITEPGLAAEYDHVAAQLNRVVNVHVKIDTGMGRLGMSPQSVTAFFRQMKKYAHLKAEGIFTHLSVADSAEHASYTASQLEEFREVLGGLTASGFHFSYVHAANSAATIASPQSHFSLVRVGVALHGIAPSAEVPCLPELRRVMTWKTIVAQVKMLPPGSNVGYGNTYRSAGTERIAMLPIGYADGFRLAPRNWGEVLVHGQRARIVGRVSMAMTAINVTHIPRVSVGDEVVLIGQQEEEVITAEDVAERLDTIPYEVICAIGDHIPRVV